MEIYARWKQILFRARKLLPLDIEHCSPLALRNIILDVRTPSWVLDNIAQVYYDDEYILRELVRCPNLSETTLAFISLTASDEIRTFIAGTRVVDVVMGEEEQGGAAGGKKKLNVVQQIQLMTPAQKIKLALAGGKDARGILVKSSNKMISMAVLENPRLTDGRSSSLPSPRTSVRTSCGKSRPTPNGQRGIPWPRPSCSIPRPLRASPLALSTG